MKSRIGTIISVLCVAAGGNLLAYYIVRVPTQFEFVILATALFAYPVVRNPLVGLYISFVLSPFIPYLRRLYYLAYDRPKIDPLIVLTDIVIIFMIVGLFFEFMERREEERPISQYKWLILFYFVYMVFRTVVFNDLPLGDAVAQFKFYGPPVLFFFIGVVYAPQMGHLRNFWSLTVLLGVAAAAYGLNQLYTGYSTAEKIWFNSTQFTSLYVAGVARPFSFFQAPAAFADYAMIAILASILMFSWSKNPFKLVLLAPVALFGYAILITSVRSNWIGMILTVVLWFIVNHVKGLPKRIGFLVALAAVYMAWEAVSGLLGGGLGVGDMIQAGAGRLSDQERLGPLISQRTSAITNPFEEHSLISRLNLWQFLIRTSFQPILGFMGRGVGALRADSLYLTYLAELGYPGLILICSILVIFIRKGFHIIDNSKRPDVVVLASGVTVMNLVFVVISITGSHIHSFPGDMYFWFWNGVLMKLSIALQEPVAGTDHHDNTAVTRLPA